MTGYGRDNPNYRHGNYCGEIDRSDFEQALAKDLLRRVLTTKCDSRGNLPFTQEEQQWALQVCMERPDWARQTLKACGITEK